MVSPQRLTVLLTCAGALPFYLLQLPVFDAGVRLFAFIGYGAVIASFMAGTLWGWCRVRNGLRLRYRCF